MGNFNVKILNDKAVSLSYTDKVNNTVLNNSTNAHINRYKQILNHYGYYIININQVNLKKN
jgi:hypothetical protein